MKNEVIILIYHIRIFCIVLYIYMICYYYFIFNVILFEELKSLKILLILIITIFLINILFLITIILIIILLRKHLYIANLNLKLLIHGICLYIVKI